MPEGRSSGCAPRLLHTFDCDAGAVLALVVRGDTVYAGCRDGLVKVWDVSGPSGGGSLKLSWSYDGLETSSDLSPDGDLPGATAVEAIKTDLKKVAVAYQNAVIKIFDIESGKELSKFHVDPVEGGEWQWFHVTP